jgi:hypothetical protein
VLHNSRELLLNISSKTTKNAERRTQNAQRKTQNKKSNSTRCKKIVVYGGGIVSFPTPMPCFALALISSIMFPCLCSSLHVPVPCVVRCLSFCFAVLWLVVLRGVINTFLDATLLSVGLLAVYVRRGVTSLTDAQWYNPVSLGAAGFLAPRFEFCLHSPWPASFLSAVGLLTQSTQRSTSVRSAQINRLK